MTKILIFVEDHDNELRRKDGSAISIQQPIPLAEFSDLLRPKTSVAGLHLQALLDAAPPNSFVVPKISSATHAVVHWTDSTINSFNSAAPIETIDRDQFVLFVTSKRPGFDEKATNRSFAFPRATSFRLFARNVAALSDHAVASAFFAISRDTAIDVVAGMKASNVSPLYRLLRGDFPEAVVALAIMCKVVLATSFGAKQPPPAFAGALAAVFPNGRPSPWRMTVDHATLLRKAAWQDLAPKLTQSGALPVDLSRECEVLGASQPEIECIKALLRALDTDSPDLPLAEMAKAYLSLHRLLAQPGCI